MADPLIQKFRELTMQRSLASRTREATPPTWGQMKRLTQEAEKTLMNVGQPLNPTNLLLATMAVVTCQVIGISASNHTYWAYRPNPPLVRAISWGNQKCRYVLMRLTSFPGQLAWE